MLRLARALTVSNWCSLAVATWELAIARCCHARDPVGKIILRLKETCGRAQDCGDAVPAGLDIARVAWAIGAASRLVPWRSDCLIQVMAAERWLRRHNIATLFFLGVAKDETGNLRAHAWLSCGAVVVAGAHGDGFLPLIEPDQQHEALPRPLNCQACMLPR